MTFGDWLILACIGLIVAWFKWSFPAYLAEKGKNLATREDVEELTHKVEAVKSQYLSELERLRFELARSSTIHKAQYEAEFRTYEEIWQLLVEVQRAAMSLRPMVDFGLGPNETEESRRNRRLTEFGEKFNAFTAIVWKRKPFYPDEIHAALQELSRLVHGEAIDYQYGTPKGDPEYWKEARRNAEALSNQIEVICAAIRNRLSGLSVA